MGSDGRAGQDDGGPRVTGGGFEPPDQGDTGWPPPEPVRTVVVPIGEARRARRQVPRGVVAGLGIVVVVAVLAAAFFLLQGPGGRHADGAGILASSGSPDFHNSWSRDARSTGPVTGAIRLCLERGTAPAVVESIGPDRVVGAGWRYLGASIRVFTPGADHTPIISMDRYPPPLPDELVPASGFNVTTPCGQVGAGPYSELLIGFSPADLAGGGWDGVDVTYRVAGVEYVLVVRQAFVQCGTAPLPDYCPGS